GEGQVVVEIICFIERVRELDLTVRIGIELLRQNCLVAGLVAVEGIDERERNSFARQAVVLPVGQNKGRGDFLSYQRRQGRLKVSHNHITANLAHSAMCQSNGGHQRYGENEG